MTENGLTSKVLALPDTNLQLNRMMSRRKFNCPNCRGLCPCTYVFVPGKDVREADVVIHCEKCGDVTLECRVVGFSSKYKVKDTGKRYDPAADTKRLYKRMSSAKKSDLKAYVDVCNRYADQLEMEGFTDQLCIPYINSMSAILDDLKSNGMGNLEYACHQTLRCCDVCKLELFDVLIKVYETIEENEALLPEPLFLRVMVEYYCLYNAYHHAYLIDYFTYNNMIYVAERFEGMSPDDRLVFPFTAVEAYRFAMKDRMNYGTVGEVRAVARKVVAAVEDALRAGAVPELKHVFMYMNSLKASGVRGRNPYKVALERLDEMGASNLCRGIVSGVYVDHVYNSKLCDDKLRFKGGSPRVLKDVLRRVEVTIGCLRDEPCLYDIGFYLVEAYAIRGIINKDDSDADIALKYLDFFSAVSCITEDDVDTVCMMITENFKSPEIKRGLSRIFEPMPVFDRMVDGMNVKPKMV